MNKTQAQFPNCMRKLSGIVEAAETYLLKCRKGERKLKRETRRLVFRRKEPAPLAESGIKRKPAARTVN